MKNTPPLSPQPRCRWATQEDEAYTLYHDQKWGVPIHEDKQHFAIFTLESAQAGLSWKTILAKEEGYKRCFANFDIQKVAHFDEKKMQALCQDPSIVRNEQKIRATINNARCILAIQATFGSFDTYIWEFVENKPITNHWKNTIEVPAKTPLSTHISKTLKKQGFKFIGPTIVYSYMQAAGLVNDHIKDCFRHQEIINQTLP